jgi:hypothetical protein
MAQVQKITFEDHGQDFLQWYVREGVVIDCQPHQGAVWVGRRLQYPDGPLQAGHRVSIEFAEGGTLVVDYPLEAVEILSIDEAVEVEGYARQWLKILNIPAARLGL